MFMLIAKVLPAPMPVAGGMINTASKVLMVGGLLLVLSALPPVRKAVATLVENIYEYFYGPRELLVEIEETSVLDVIEPESKVRSEIRNFDFDSFT